MRVLGVDPSSGCCGVSAVDVGPRGGITVLRAFPYFPGDVSKEDDKQRRFRRSQTMANFATVLEELHWELAFELVMYEQVAMSQNTNTVRLLAYYEACVLMLAGRYALEVYAVTATMARRLVLGKGGLSKEDCWEPFMEKYGGHFAWPEKGSNGADDVVDAAILAMAGLPLLKERGA